MGAVIEIKYFNTFILKKLCSVGGASGMPAVDPTNIGVQPSIWGGSYGIPVEKQGFGNFKGKASATLVPPTDPVFGYSQPINPPPNASVANWSIEESRIRGGYNNTSVSLGAKAYLVEEEPQGTVRGNAMIYSGIFNSRTGVNNTNVFSVSDDIVKAVDPANGSIQKLYAEDTNLTIFQELKLSRALIDKDAIYSAEGGGTVTSANLVIGAIQPIYGEYGISRDPQSFAVYGANKYFTDKNNNVVLKLAGAQLQEISKANMVDYFRDRFNKEIDRGGVPGTIIGGWDIYNKQYVLSTQINNVQYPSFNENYETITWDESIQGWTSFFSYKPDHMMSIQNNFYSIKDGDIYKHYRENVPRNTFYGTSYDSRITFVFNPEVGASKNFLTVDYEGSNGWQIDEFASDLTGADIVNSSSSWRSYRDATTQVYSYTEGKYDSQVPPQSYPNATVPPFFWAGFNRKENKYTANLINNSETGEGEVLFGSDMSGIKGYLATVTISTDEVTEPGGEKELFSVGSRYVRNNGY